MHIMSKINIVFAVALSLMLFVSCGYSPSVPDVFSKSNEYPDIYPDYRNVTIPYNIAPLNFALNGDYENCVARFSYPNGEYVCGNGNKIIIAIDEWKDMLQKSVGKNIKVEVYAETSDKWVSFVPFYLTVVEDPIDQYISYRVIQPSYVAYELLSINQRDLTNFDETQIYNNMLVSDENNGQCINCHSYKNYKTDNMQFHMRQGNGGTVIVNNGVAKKVDLKTDSTLSAGVYPSWHPTKNYIAYSTNLTGQSFHTKDAQKVEVQDTKSDLILYDVDANEVSIISALDNELEIYPWWAPDGKTLYFGSAFFEFKDTVPNETESISRYKEVKYDLYRKSFDPESKKFGERELVFSASSINKSATLPRVSPDGRYLMFSMGEWGCFHIWHHDSDIYLMDLVTKNVRKLENVNSASSESYHSWSSNGRWMIISSRRNDNNYTRPFIAYFDKKGYAHKAFELPQEDPEHHLYFTRSYNIPEFMIEPVKITPQEFASTAKSKAIKAKYVNNK